MTANSIDWKWPNTDVNITLLPFSDPLCANKTCLEFAAAADASQAQISWLSQFDYGYYTSYFYCAIIAVFTLAHGYSFFRRAVSNPLSQRSASSKPSATQRARAAWRRIGYRRLSGWANTVLPASFGMSLLIVISVAFSVALCFVQRPYYRETRGFGSPPLGVRAGLAATAMTPITLALSGKYNFVTLLTGISYERLHILHRWAGYIYLFFSIVHTIPFLLNDLASGGPARLYYQFYYKGSMEYTGIAPLAVLVFLCVPYLIPGVKQKMYELFIYTHILGWLAFLGTMFWHAADMMDSWMYLYVTIGIWVAQLFVRWFDKSAALERRRNGEAAVTLLDDGTGEALMMRIEVDAAMYWAPSQHCFLRFAKWPLDNHPFTIASIHEGQDPVHGANRLVVLVRPLQGFTRRLLEHVRASPFKQVADHRGSVQAQGQCQMEVTIDGPYGGMSGWQFLHQRFDQIVMIAGGSGISAMLPWMLHFTSMMDSESSCRTTSMHLVWCVQHVSAISWITEELAFAAKHGIEVSIFVTQERSKATGDGIFDGGHTEPAKTPTCEEKVLSPDAGTTSSGQEKASYGSRPVIHKLLEQTIAGPSTIVMACGPESLKIDVSNAVAALQSRVLKDFATEIALHTESFGW